MGVHQCKSPSRGNGQPEHIQTGMVTCKNNNTHTYVRTYIHTYIHTYIALCTHSQSSVCAELNLIDSHRKLHTHGLPQTDGGRSGGRRDMACIALTGLHRRVETSAELCHLIADGGVVDPVIVGPDCWRDRRSALVLGG